MKSQPLICVDDVEVSSLWYQKVLNCRSAHGGKEYERLVTEDGELVLQLYHWEEDHHHGKIGEGLELRGNGVLLWFEVEDFDDALMRVEEVGAEVILPKHRNPPEGDYGPNHWEIWLKDPNGYKVVLASPTFAELPENHFFSGQLA